MKPTDLRDLVRAFFRQMTEADAELTMNQPDEGMALAHTMTEMKRAVGLLEKEAGQ